VTAAVAVDGRAYEAAAERRDTAAEAERAAFAAWEQAYGAYEVARDECAQVLRRVSRTPVSR
jgi:hypothetical protein